MIADIAFRKDFKAFLSRMKSFQRKLAELNADIKRFSHRLDDFGKLL